MLSFDNTLCAAQISARPKSSYPFYEKLYTYVSPRVSEHDYGCGVSLYGLAHKANYVDFFLKLAKFES